MDQLNPQPLQFQQPRPHQMPPGMYPSQQMLQPGFMRHPYDPFSFTHQMTRKKQLAKGIYITGFENTLTVEMLEMHFKIKPIFSIKIPMSKYHENKGFAYIYYGSQQDAIFVQKKLDRTVILRNQIRVKKTVIPSCLSKMIFRLKKTGLSQEQISQVEELYFNEKNLEKQVQRIIQQVFKDFLQVYSVTIPLNKKTKKPLKYARTIFYVSNLKETFLIVNQVMGEKFQKGEKNYYQVVLDYIANLLNSNDFFKKNATAEIYEYTKKNYTTTLHLKGIKNSPNANEEKLAIEVKDFVKNQYSSSKIVSSYAKISEKFGTWANLTCQTPEQAQAIYQLFKTQKIFFNGAPLYVTLKNMMDHRTVVISTVKNQVTDFQMGKFLKNLVLRQREDSKKERFDFFSFNIICEKEFYKVNNQTISVKKGEKAEQWWVPRGKVPKRVVIHFYNQFQQKDLRELAKQLDKTENYEQTFASCSQQLRISNQKGHIKNDIYVRHILSNLKKKKEKNIRQKQTDSRKPVPYQKRNHQTNDYSQFNRFNFNKTGVNAPRSGDGVPILNKPIQSSNVPFMGMKKTGAEQRIPVMGNMMGHLPQMGSLPNSPFSVPMGQMPIPTMGQMPPSMKQGNMVHSKEDKKK